MTAEQWIKNNYGAKWISTTSYPQGGQSAFWDYLDDEYNSKRNQRSPFPPAIPLGPSNAIKICKGTEHVKLRKGESIESSVEDVIYYSHSCYWREYDPILKYSIIVSYPRTINYAAIHNFIEGDRFNMNEERVVKLVDIMEVGRGDQLFGLEEIGKEKEGILYLSTQQFLRMLISYNVPYKNNK